MLCIHRSVLAALWLLLLPAVAAAQEKGQPGDFDFYVLALSWSPSFCEAAQERSRRAPAEQCSGRPYSFVVHGLWPQHDKGFPEFCQVPAPRLDRNIVSSMLDLMPSRRLVFQAWDKHGTCAGLSARRYFDRLREARERVTIPADYQEASAREVAPADVEVAFLKANPGLTPGAISVTCDSHRLSEVRLCLTKDLDFRDCSELERRSCRRAKLRMPASR